MRKSASLSVVVLVASAVGCVDDDGDDASCSASADICSGDTICISGQCEAAFGRLYSVTNVTVQLPTTDGSGAAWDVGGGAPDIFVEFFVNNASVGRSSTTQDMFSAAFAGPFSVQPIGGGALEVRAFDEDLTVNDLAFTCAATPLTAALLRGRDLQCAAAGGAVMFRIDPS